MSFLVNTTRETPATRNVVESVIVGVLLTALSYVVGHFAGWGLTEGWLLWLEVFAVFTSYSCTYLCVRERRIQYPIGAISTLAYAYLFYKFGLNASAVLNLWLTAQLLYGWFRWRSDADTRPVKFVQLKWWPAYLAATGVFFAVGYWLNTLAGGELAATDVTILTLSILAQWLLDNKKWETWVVWLAVNGFAIYTYFNAELYLVGFQYIFFAANVFYGAYVWWKSMQSAKEPVEITQMWQDDRIITHEFVRGKAHVSPGGYNPYRREDALKAKQPALTDNQIVSTSVLQGPDTYSFSNNTYCAPSDSGSSYSGTDVGGGGGCD